MADVGANLYARARAGAEVLRFHGIYLTRAGGFD